MGLHGFKRIVRRVLFALTCLVSIAFFIFPFFWVLLMSLKQPDAAQAIPPAFIFWPTFENFRLVLSEGEFVHALFNSIVVTAFTLIANLIISLPAAYIIARRRQKWLSFGILFTQMAPWIVKNTIWENAEL